MEGPTVKAISCGGLDPSVDVDIRGFPGLAGRFPERAGASLTMGGFDDESD